MALVLKQIALHCRIWNTKRTSAISNLVSVSMYVNQRLFREGGYVIMMQTNKNILPVHH